MKIIMQLKTFNRIDKENLLTIKFQRIQNLDLLIFPAGHQYSTSDPFILYPSLPNKHTNALVENPFRQKKISGVWEHVFGTDEQVSQLFHNSCIEKTIYFYAFTYHKMFGLQKLLYNWHPDDWLLINQLLLKCQFLCVHNLLIGLLMPVLGQKKIKLLSFASSAFFYLFFFESYEKCNQKNVK